MAEKGIKVLARPILILPCLISDFHWAYYQYWEGHQSICHPNFKDCAKILFKIFKSLLTDEKEFSNWYLTTLNLVCDHTIGLISVASFYSHKLNISIMKKFMYK